MSVERDQALWDRYVGSQGPLEFMELSGGMNIEEAVEDYLIHLDDMFGPGTADNAPEDLGERLAAYLRDECP